MRFLPAASALLALALIAPLSGQAAPQPPAATQAVTPEAILDHLTHHVAKWWLPDEILFVDSLPHTATGKLLKTALREQYKDYRLTSAA